MAAKGLVEKSLNFVYFLLKPSKWHFRNFEHRKMDSGFIWLLFIHEQKEKLRTGGSCFQVSHLNALPSPFLLSPLGEQDPPRSSKKRLIRCFVCFLLVCLG